MGEESKAQLDPSDELGWLVDIASSPLLPDVVGRKICKKAAARAKQKLLDLRAELAEARAGWSKAAGDCREACLERDHEHGRAERVQLQLDAARRAVGEAWFQGGSTLAEAIERKARALESMPGARALALVDAVLASHRDDIPPRIRDLAKAVQRAAAEPPATNAERPVAYWTCDEYEEALQYEDIDEAVEAWLDQADIDWDDEDATVTVYGFARMEVSWCPEFMLERALEDIDEDHADPNGKGTKPTPAMIAAAEAFARVLESEYESWACEQVTTREVPVLAWVREHAPHWLPAAGGEGGVA